MTLDYAVQTGYDEWDNFEYDVSIDDINEYFDEAVSKEEMIELAREAFARATEEEQNEITNWAKENTPECVIDGKLDVAAFYEVDTDNYFLKELIISDEELYEEGIKDYLESRAREQFADAEAERKDPYGYRGLDPRMFY